MNEDQLRELFKATNTAEPLSEGWPGLLRYGLAVAAAERDACAAVAESFDFDERHEIDPPRTLPRYVAQAIRMRSNVNLRGGITMGNGMKAYKRIEKVRSRLAGLAGGYMQETVTDAYNELGRMATEIERLREGLRTITCESINAEYMAQNILDGLPPYHMFVSEVGADGTATEGHNG